MATCPLAQMESHWAVRSAPLVHALVLLHAASKHTHLLSMPLDCDKEAYSSKLPADYFFCTCECLENPLRSLHDGSH